MAASTEAGDDISVRLKRARYRAWHRGTREMDLILGPFADVRLPRFTMVELDRFEALLDEADTDLLDWVLGQAAVPARIDPATIVALKTFRQAQAAQQ